MVTFLFSLKCLPASLKVGQLCWRGTEACSRWIIVFRRSLFKCKTWNAESYVIRLVIHLELRQSLLIWWSQMPWSSFLHLWAIILLLQDFISDSPYCLQYNSCDVRSENLVLDGLIISCLYCFSILRRNSVLVTHRPKIKVSLN